jgi:hypothetical protein
MDVRVKANPNLHFGVNGGHDGADRNSHSKPFVSITYMKPFPLMVYSLGILGQNVSMFLPLFTIDVPILGGHGVEVFTHLFLV